MYHACNAIYYIQSVSTVESYSEAFIHRSAQRNISTVFRDPELDRRCSSFTRVTPALWSKNPGTTSANAMCCLATRQLLPAVFSWSNARLCYAFMPKCFLGEWVGLTRLLIYTQYPSFVQRREWEISMLRRATISQYRCCSLVL